MILLGAGIVHRVGPHRLYVKLARALAELGFVVLRFDFSGIGDSRARGDTLPFEQSAVAETREAMDWLCGARDVNRFLLIALCSGAGFSFRTACADPRVVGLVLINAAGHRWGTSAERDRTLTRHYWRVTWSRSFRRNNWRKLLTLDFDRHSILRAVANRLRTRVAPAAEEPPAADRIAAAFEALMDRGVRVLILYSEGDEGLDYYRLFLRPRLRAVVAHACFRFAVVPGANHTFTLLSHQRALLAIVREWADSIG